ncbi:MAG: DUF2249 domain-containing protein [Gemmatimonadota bacterium]|nr:DUF2249 domain-containing protein [Gemmatimonadota bacterium]
MITSATRVSEALTQRPELREVLVAFHPAFTRLHHPVLGRVLPRLVTVADAARIAGVDVEALVAVMNCPVSAHPALSAEAAGPPAQVEALAEATPQPAEPPPRWFDVSATRSLDVRPLIERGEEPLAQILAAIRGLGAGGQLTLIAPFDPVPLVGLLSRQGWSAWTRWDEGACFVTFGRAASGEATPAESTPPMELLETEGGWTLDVRQLPPPEPMRQVLAAVDAGRLPLRIVHAREPALLWPALQERGLQWTVSHSADAVLIDVRRG